MRSRLRIVLLGTLAVAAFLALAPPAAAGASSPLSPDRIAELARLLGYDAGAFQDVESEDLTLIDGTRIERFKAFDLATGEVVGGAFEEGRPVDFREAQRAAAEAWRAVHGALTPELVARLERLAPGEATPVVAWLDVDLSSVTERQERRPLRQERGTALGEPAGPAGPEDARVAAGEKPQQEVEKPASPQRSLLTLAERQAIAARQEELARQDAEHLAAVRAAIAPAREAFLTAAAAAGVEVSYASEVAPMVVLSATREQLEAMAFWYGVDALYDGSGQGGPSLQYARPTQNVTPINNVGYDGTGINVAVTEGERGFAANPYLTWAGFFDGGQPYADHPTAVGGMIRSTHPTQHGLAAGVSLYSANGSYSSFGTMSAAMDWGSSQARVLSNSWYWDSVNSPTPWAADRHQDWFVRFSFDSVLVAAGNFGNGCGGGFSTYVVSPAKGNNILAIGNDDDANSIPWSGDSMNVCSSFGDPQNSTGGTIAKPEMSGVGTTITSTIVSTDPNNAVGPVGSGTSYSTPMVAAAAAAIMEADPGLEPNPEAVKAILMATALHNIEGASRYSDVDGSGSLVGAAAAVSAERGNWSDQLIGAGTSFPITKTQFAYAGETVRFVLAWSSNPNGTYATDPLPADLDLTAYRADGTTVIASSASFNNAFEIVQFTAPASEVYQFRISLFSSDWSSGSTWMGTGLWRGEYRISPDVPYHDPDAPPTGTHLAVHPTDWTPSNYWRVMGVRPSGTSDYDLELANHSLFEDPGLRNVLRTSLYASQTPDFVVVDGNQWPASSPEHYRVLRFSGSDGYDVSFSNLGLGASNSTSTVTLGPISMSGFEVAKAVDIWVPALSHRRVRVVPVSGSANLGLRGFKSDPGSSASWAQARNQAVIVRNRTSLGTATERGGFFNATGSGDWLGLIVEKFDAGTVTFNVVVLPPSLFSDDFESGDTAEWSGAVP